MVIVRSSRLEEKRARKRLGIAILGSIALIVFFGIFGIKLLVGFSLLIDKMRGSAPAPTPSQTFLFPPILDPLPEATKSANITLTGSAQNGTQALIFINDEQYKRVSIDTEGKFSVLLPSFSEGTQTIRAKIEDEKKNTSEFSNALTITIKKTPPILELSAPEDHASLSGDDNRIQLSGKTEEDTTVTVNSRIIVVRSDNTFSYQFPLNTGENKLTIIATDRAGNTTTVERIISYQP